MLTTETQTFKALSSVKTSCDGANARDGHGFSGYDASFAHDVIDKGQRWGWTAKQFEAAKRLAHKYRKQIEALGYSPAEIAAEGPPQVRERVRQEETFKFVRLHRIKGRSDTGKALFVFPEAGSRWTHCIPVSKIRTTHETADCVWLELPLWIITEKDLGRFVQEPPAELQRVATSEQPEEQALADAIETQRQFNEERAANRTRRMIDA